MTLKTIITFDPFWYVYDVKAITTDRLDWCLNIAGSRCPLPYILLIYYLSFDLFLCLMPSSQHHIDYFKPTVKVEMYISAFDFLFYFYFILSVLHYCLLGHHPTSDITYNCLIHFALQIYLVSNSTWALCGRIGLLL